MISSISCIITFIFELVTFSDGPENDDSPDVDVVVVDGCCFDDALKLEDFLVTESLVFNWFHIGVTYTAADGDVVGNCGVGVGDDGDDCVFDCVDAMEEIRL